MAGDPESPARTAGFPAEPIRPATSVRSAASAECPEPAQPVRSAVQQNAPEQPGGPNLPGAAANNQYGTAYSNQQCGTQPPGAAPNAFQTDQAGTTAANAAADFKAALIDARGRGRRTWGPFGIILFGMLIFISAFLPLVNASASGFGFQVSASCSYFYCGGYCEAGMVFLGILTILPGIVPGVVAALLVVNKGITPFRLRAAVTAALSALYGVIMSIIFIASLPAGGGFGVSAGPGLGTILLLIS